ncbi:btb (poz) domain-containing 2a-related [Anaeramoeba flamelloides]|uniref:Btb (Poz) domain-containing 2a-related n=1 Tax=Anaeramoeba flamelloides TaxID=1746091 RepID=A0AAV7ZIJ6_9EUKA|nr:btb (poz) domain-containing 2a-related [Anaeramoeba flamelloides]
MFDMETNPISEDIRKLINSPEIADVNFVIGPTKCHMYGHQILLSLNSQFFLRLFYGINSNLKIQNNKEVCLKLNKQKESQKINNLKRSTTNPIRIEKEKKIDFKKNKENGIKIEQKGEKEKENENENEMQRKHSKEKSNHSFDQPIGVSSKPLEKVEKNKVKFNQENEKTQGKAEKEKEKRKEKEKTETNKKKEKEKEKEKITEKENAKKLAQEMLKIIIPDIAEKAFKLFLDFFYTKKVILTKKDVWSVLVCSLRFQVPELKQTCVTFLLSTLTLSTIFKDLEKAIKHNLFFLIPALTSFIETRSEELFQIMGCLNELCNETIYKILALSRLRINGIELFRRLSERGKYLCVTNGLTISPINIRKSLNNLLNAVKLETLSSDELIEVIRSNLIGKEIIRKKVLNNNHLNGKKLDMNIINYLNNEDSKNNGLIFFNYSKRNNTLLSKRTKYQYENTDGNGDDEDDEDDDDYDYSYSANNENIAINDDNESEIEKDFGDLKDDERGKQIEPDRKMGIEQGKEIKEEIDQEIKKEIENEKKTKELEEENKSQNKIEMSHLNVDEYKEQLQIKIHDKQYQVALLTNDINIRWVNDVKGSICGKSGKIYVKVFDIKNYLPNINQLSQFDLIFHYCNNNYQDANKIGDLLYDCLEKGIPCVVSTCFFATEDRKRQIGGKFSKIKELKDLCGIYQDSGEDSFESESESEYNDGDDDIDNNNKHSQYDIKIKKEQNYDQEQKDDKKDDDDYDDDDDKIECAFKLSKIGKRLLPKHKILSSIRSFIGGKKSYRTKGINEIGKTIVQWTDKSFLISIIKVTKDKVPLVLMNFFPVSQNVFTRTSDKFSDNDFNGCFHQGGRGIINNTIKYLIKKKKLKRKKISKEKRKGRKLKRGGREGDERRKRKRSRKRKRDKGTGKRRRTGEKRHREERRRMRKKRKEREVKRRRGERRERRRRRRKRSKHDQKSKINANNIKLKQNNDN